MGSIITVASQKGGVGKTTTSLNLAYSLSGLAPRVLLIDADPQGSVAIASNLASRTTDGIINVLKAEASPQDVIVKSRHRGLHVLGAGMMEPEDVLMYEGECRGGSVGHVIREIAQGFDYTIIDAPAGVGVIVNSMLGISTGALLVQKCDTLTLKTMPTFLKLLRWVEERSGGVLGLEGVLINMLDRRNHEQMRIYEEVLEGFPEGALFRTVIPYDERFLKASALAMPVGMISKDGTSELQRHYTELALEIKEREIEREGGVADESSEGLF